MSSVLPGLGDALVTADHLGDDEGEELLGEFGVEVRVLGENPQAGDLSGLARFIGRRQPVFGLELADPFGEFEPLGQEVDEGGVDIVDAVAQLDQSLLGGCLSVSVVLHGTSLTMSGDGSAPRLTDRGALRLLLRQGSRMPQPGTSTGTASFVSGSFSVPALRSARYFFISFLTTGISR